MSLLYHGYMDKHDWHQLLHREPETNKYDYGHVLVIGGSEEMIGAPVLVARAALRVGAGLVTVASNAAALRVINRDAEEIMTHALPPWHETDAIAREVHKFSKQRHVTAVVMGPGLPIAAEEALRKLLAIKVPLILDARAITALSGHLTVLKKAAKSTDIILTPHTGEYAKLTNSELLHNAEIEEVAVREFAQEYGVTLVLKRRHSLVANAQGEMYENHTGNPGLATAGSGDVLSGMVVGILAQHIEPFMAAKMAVYLHGLAGDFAAEAKTEPGMIASDIIEAIPQALKFIDG